MRRAVFLSLDASGGLQRFGFVQSITMEWLRRLLAARNASLPARVGERGDIVIAAMSGDAIAFWSWVCLAGLFQAVFEAVKGALKGGIEGFFLSRDYIPRGFSRKCRLGCSVLLGPQQRFSQIAVFFAVGQGEIDHVGVRRLHHAVIDEEPLRFFNPHPYTLAHDAPHDFENTGQFKVLDCLGYGLAAKAGLSLYLP